MLRPDASAAVVVARAHTIYTYKARDVVHTGDNAGIVAEIGKAVGLELEDVINIRLDKLNAVARPRSRGRIL